MNMTIATTTTTPTDIRYEYMDIIDMTNIFLNFFATTISFTILSSVIVYISNIVFLWKENIYMNRLQVVSAIERRNKIQVIDDMAFTLGRGRL
jgi:hypothetical protein